VQWTHLTRFIAEEDGQIHLGQVDPSSCPDDGLALYKGEEVKVKLIEGDVFSGTVTKQEMTIKHLLSPLSVDQVSCIRCLGLNYADHAKEANLALPKAPILFIKPRLSLNGPYPAAIVIPKLAQDDSSDYEAELTIVIGKDGKDIKEADAMDYVLAYTCGNDVSARTAQLMTSQWCFGKGQDYAAPIGPILVRPSQFADPHALDIEATLNGETMQSSNTRELIFNIPKTLAFLSQGTTLEKGSLIMTGTSAGIGMARNPKVWLKDGDEMIVKTQGIGSLINKVVYE